MQFKRIKDLREDNDLLQKDIASILGISQQYYSEYENWKRTITISHLITLAKYYNVSIDYLVGLSNFKNENKKIQLWDQDDVIDVYDKLQSVNQSVNSILKIDDSLGN